MYKIFLCVLLCLLFSACTPKAENSEAELLPEVSKYFNDYAHCMSKSMAARLDTKLAARGLRSTDQIVVLTVPTTNGESIEDYAAKVFERYAIGKSGKDNGVLLVVSMKEKSARIEVGRGMEGVLPDMTAKRILREHISANFRAGKYEKGMEETVDELLKQTERRK